MVPLAKNTENTLKKRPLYSRNIYRTSSNSTSNELQTKPDVVNTTGYLRKVYGSHQGIASSASSNKRRAVEENQLKFSFYRVCYSVF